MKTENWTMNNVLFKSFLKFLWKHLCQSLFLIKLQLGSVQLHWKQDCRTAVFCDFLGLLFSICIFNEHLRKCLHEEPVKKM